MEPENRAYDFLLRCNVRFSLFLKLKDSFNSMEKEGLSIVFALIFIPEVLVWYFKHSRRNTMANKEDNKHDHKSERGFASMDSERQREIAAEGGRAAHEKGTAHEFDSEEARKAGEKGGKASHGNKSSSSGNR